MARGRTRRGGDYGEFWPGYVDVLSTLLLVVTFLLSIFMLAQYFVTEEASGKDLFDSPGHPYTKGLLGSIPHLDTAAGTGRARPRLNEIKGMVPSLFNLPPGCSFAPRCGFATDE